MPNNSRLHPLALPVFLALGAANFSYAQASAPDSAQVTTAAIAEPAAVPVADAAATPPAAFSRATSLRNARTSVVSDSEATLT